MTLPAMEVTDVFPEYDDEGSSFGRFVAQFDVELPADEVGNRHNIDPVAARLLVINLVCEALLATYPDLPSTPNDFTTRHNDVSLSYWPDMAKVQTWAVLAERDFEQPVLARVQVYLSSKADVRRNMTITLSQRLRLDPCLHGAYVHALVRW